jgi:DNA polymerase III delta prime subunit
MHQKQWEFLKRSAKLGRIPHALLFSGSSPEKKTVALEFIRLINGPDIKEGHADLHIIEPGESREIKISQIRELHSKLSLKAYSAQFKSIIIDQAHALNWEAQSSFLKLLEEPKGDTLFILITEYPERLLPTILSRVERLRFHSAFPPCRQEKVKELLKIRSSDLAQRFQYAKKLSEDPAILKETLEDWLRYFRSVLLSDANRPEVVKIVKTIQTIHYLISTTNVNSKLALEVLMLEL